LRSRCSPGAEALVARAVELAKSGDGVALRLCIERLIPRKRSGSSTVEIDLPRIPAVRRWLATELAGLRNR